MSGESLGLILAAIVTTAGAVLIAVINRRALGRIESSQNTMAAHAENAATDAKAVAESVRTRNGRTLAQTVEDNIDELAQLRGDMMELAIQFARHTSDPHTHDLVRRYRQSQRDRLQLGQDTRDMTPEDQGRRAHGRGPDFHEDLDDWGQ